MKILFVTKNLPFPLDDGSNLRLYNITKQLSKKHELYLFSLVNKQECKKYESDIAEFFKSIHYVDIPGKSSNTLYKKWRDRLAKKKAYDAIEEVIINNKIDVAHMHYHIPATFTIKKVSQLIPVVTDFVDSMSLYQMRRKVKLSVFNLPNVIKRHLYIYISNRIEKYVMNHSVVSLAVSENDIKSLRRHSSDAVLCVNANGVDTDFFNPSVCDKHKNSNKQTIVFIGNMNFPPNIDAVTYFVNEIYPLIRKVNKSIDLKIVGKNPVSVVKKLTKNDGVQVLGYVDDVRDYYCEATVIVIPMVSGGGIKNKVLEAFSMSKVIVSTSLGVEAISCIDNEHVLIADNPETFSEKVINIMDGTETQIRMGEKARELVINEYSWENVAHDLESIYEPLLLRKA